MNRLLNLVTAALILFPAAALAQVAITDTVKLGEASTFTKNEAFQRYITRGNFCNLILDNLIFSETRPGSFMLDLTMNFNTDNNQRPRQLRVLFDDLIQILEVGKPMALGKSGDWLAKKITLTNISDIEIEFRLIPVVEEKYNEAYKLIKPILNQPIYGLPLSLDIGSVFDKFASIASADDRRTALLFKATIPVPQNIIEAQAIEKQPIRPPLRNNEVIAIAMEGSKEVADPSLVGKARDFLSGVSSFVAGKNLTQRPISSFRGAVSLRFTKDFTQPLSDILIYQLKELSDAADQVYSADALSRVATKASDAIKAIEAAAKAKDIDGRAEFHLRNYVDLARVWTYYKLDVVDKTDASNQSQWGKMFRIWHSKVNIQGQPQFTQAFAISDIYPNRRMAKILVPYSLPDEMTLETIQRQTLLHQALADQNDLSCAER